MHLAAPILPSCNYCGNPTHKVNECNIPYEDVFCDYYGKKEHHEAICFAKFPKWKQFWLPRQNLPTSSTAKLLVFLWDGLDIIFPNPTQSYVAQLCRDSVEETVKPNKD